MKFLVQSWCDCQIAAEKILQRVCPKKKNHFPYALAIWHDAADTMIKNRIASIEKASSHHYVDSSGRNL